MRTKLEAQVREELDRAGRVIETLRRDPSRLTREALMHYAETMAVLDAAWEQAHDAVEALAFAVDEDAARYSIEFGDAWRLLKAHIRKVQRADRRTPKPRHGAPLRKPL